MNRLLQILDTVLSYRWVFDLFFQTVDTVKEKLLENEPNPLVLNPEMKDDAHERSAS